MQNLNSSLSLKTHQYIHILDEDTNLTHLVVGPYTYTKKQNEQIVDGPKEMLLIPPRHYCIIENPVIMKDGEPVIDTFGQAKLRYGQLEIRREGTEHFPLYPGEKLKGGITPLQIVQPDQALRLKATHDFQEEIDGKMVQRITGTEWYFLGPGTYIPNVNVEVTETVKANFIEPNTGLKIIARRTFKDGDIIRKGGETWLETTEGVYLPKVDEHVLGVVKGYVITDKKALHLRATNIFTDRFGTKRNAGDEWLVNKEQTEYYIPGVYEEVIREVPLVVLTDSQFCIVLNPVVDGKQQFGNKQLRKGPMTFFLNPGEQLEKGIQNVYVLGKNEALLLTCVESFKDEIFVEEHDNENDNNENDNNEKKKKQKQKKKVVTRTPGEKWMVKGPVRYIPPVEVKIIEKRVSIPLHKDEGIYVRDLHTGKIRTVIGETYMLNPHEELWKKELSEIVEKLINIDVDPTVTRGGSGIDKAQKIGRDKTRVVSFRVPQNSAVQIYDYKKKTARVQFGPDLVMLGPDEDFTVLSLSAGKPKQAHQIKAIALLLGPDFTSDIIIVETSDHARLKLQLRYNWYFEVNKDIKEEATKIFQVPDFIGDMCKAVSSRVRGRVAATPFDEFHQRSSEMIREAVFGLDSEKKVRERLEFKANNLIVTDIDIQTVEPIDAETKSSLQKSVQLAISITTQSQEADARHEALKKATEAQGRLDEQKLEDEIEAEKTRKGLIGLQAECSAIETTGTAKAEATAKSEAGLIQGQSKVDQTNLRTKAEEIEAKIDLEYYTQKYQVEFEHQKEMNTLEVELVTQMSKIEADKFKDIVTTIGADTLESMAHSGPEVQANLLEGMNLNGYLITDGQNPIDLFKTAQGFLGEK
ncbi:major vault protein [Anaeramoeba ignava]|uniref:Major vault protein n=1 Tax=Anaeramoeba ignava TaxID=1746090 RepID=A0A9Q0LGU8_ANAIG|nr:major vault protein [Anaeramoeba ignava]|eukprot:Anaeramoba_ignava/c21738_g1_i2.p1 GENE.c21738_g1_i2~~c21738_g1_i2.p1  ORF type:complete len:877 (+),score=293.87 c21738_g1_i2:36-2633(+)